MNRRRAMAWTLVVFALAGVAGSTLAQEEIIPAPLPVPDIGPIPEPQDVPYGGAMSLTVDATDLTRRIFDVHQTIPVQSGRRLVLFYPQWLPGQHSPRGRVDKLAGLVIRAGETRIPWTRDPGHVFAFHVNVPEGVTLLEISFQYMAPLNSDQGRVVTSPDLLDLSWDTVVLYPAGYYVRGIDVQAAVRLPHGWEHGTALETESIDGDAVRFKTVSLETLVDSPVFAGRHFRRLLLSSKPAPVHLNIVADRSSYLKGSREQLKAHAALVREAYAVFGPPHYDRYEFLLALSDKLPALGLEHHQSSENIIMPGYFIAWDKHHDVRGLLPHEFAHSWNGKFRRPADLWTPNFNTPMRNSLLWVYEGQTQYWGIVLAARSGLITQDQAMNLIAYTAAGLDRRAGRAWRNLQDTTNDPITSKRRSLSSKSWQRAEDYYGEGLLIWLGADTLIRDLSRGRRSLGDFAENFFGIEPGRIEPVAYTFDDVVTALNDVQPYDWKAFFDSRLQTLAPGAPLDGLRRGGYRLVFSDEQSPAAALVSARRGQVDLRYSLGLTTTPSGAVVAVEYGSPAGKAALTAGALILAVDGLAFDSERIKNAVTAAKGVSAPIELIVKADDQYRTVRLDYHDGLRYPVLERDRAEPDRLKRILRPRR